MAGCSMLKRGNGEKSTILSRISQGSIKCLGFGGLILSKCLLLCETNFPTFFKAVAHSLSRQRLGCDCVWWKLRLHPPCGHCKYKKDEGLSLNSLPVLKSDQMVFKEIS